MIIDSMIAMMVDCFSNSLFYLFLNIMLIYNLLRMIKVRANINSQTPVI